MLWMPISKHCSVEMRTLSFGTNTSGPKKKYTLVSSLFRVMFLDVFRAVGMMDKSVCKMLKRYSDQVLINYTACICTVSVNIKLISKGLS